MSTVQYDSYVKKIQFVYTKYKLKKAIRTWARLVKIQEELLAAAMHPDRLGKFEQIESFHMWKH